MPADPDLLHSARKLRPSAAADLLAEYHPVIYRIARGLTGNESAARKVVRFLISRSLRVLPRWREESDPDRWFYHHAVLASRRAIGGANRSDVRRDLLVVSAGNENPEFLAFIGALRKLPFQQSEAFILSEGERFNARYLAVAMDCSVFAAESHLLAANTSLRAIAGDRWDALVSLFNRSYSNLTPREDKSRAIMRSQVARYIVPRRIFRWMRLLILITVLALLAYYAWMWRSMLLQYMPQ